MLCTNLASDVVSRAATCLSYLALCIYLAACHYYGHVAAMHIIIKNNELLWDYEFTITKFTFTENQVF